VIASLEPNHQPPVNLAAALKEWAVAIAALAAGETCLLLRKGGIRETAGQFTIAQSQVWLYPTYEHQQPQALQAPYGDQVQPVAKGWHPQQVEIVAMADITDTFVVSTTAMLAALQPHHIWTTAWAIDRWHWKPQQPLIAMCLRVYRLPSPHMIPFQPQYGGCQSWITLDQTIATSALKPVLTATDYDLRVNQLRSLCT
jgi:hypothetical protein